MDFKPPPGLRMIEFGDRLIVRVGPNASRKELGWTAAWLAVWTIAGVGSLVYRGGSGLFGIGWALIEVYVVASLVWHLFGRVLLYVTPHELEVRKELGRVSRTKRYDPALAGEVQARLTEGMDPAEARAIAAAVLGRAPQDTPLPQYQPPPAHYAPPRDDPVRRRFVLVGLVALGAIAVISASTVFERIEVRESPFSGRQGDPRVYAESMTTSSLLGAQRLIQGRPDCGKHVTWEHWTCRVRARAVEGAYAGLTLVYRCSPRYEPQPAGRAPARSIDCGPESPPPVSG